MSSVTDGTRGIPTYIILLASNNDGKSGGGPISHDCMLSPPLDGGIAPPPEPADRLYDNNKKIGI